MLYAYGMWCFYGTVGVASARLGNKLKAVHYYDESIRVAEETDKHRQSHAKAFGYKGMMLFDWSKEVPYPQGADKYLNVPTNGDKGILTPEVVELIRQRLRDEGIDCLLYAVFL